MKRFTAIISTLAVVASLTGCNKTETPTQNASENQSSSQSSTPSHESTVSQDSTSSEESTSSENTSSIEPYVPLKERDYELKGEDLITKFEWPYDAPIDLDGARAQKITTGELQDVFEDIDISDLSNEIDWMIICDYGYLATVPENGGEYEFKKYKIGDTIGDFTVNRIITYFTNAEWCKYKGCDYFQGINAGFNGEVTLTGEVSIAQERTNISEIQFYPDKESCKKLPIVNYRPLLNLEYIDDTFDDIRIDLGDKKDYPEIDFSKFPIDTRVKAKVKIKNYNCTEMPLIVITGHADIVDSELELV